MNLEHEIRRKDYAYIFEYDPIDDVSGFYSVIDDFGDADNWETLPQHKTLEYFENWCEKKGLLDTTTRTRTGFDSHNDTTGKAEWSEVFTNFKEEFEEYCLEWVEEFEANHFKQ